MSVFSHCFTTTIDFSPEIYYLVDRVKASCVSYRVENSPYDHTVTTHALTCFDLAYDRDRGNRDDHGSLHIFSVKVFPSEDLTASSVSMNIDLSREKSVLQCFSPLIVLVVREKDVPFAHVVTVNNPRGGFSPTNSVNLYDCFHLTVKVFAT